MAKRLGIGVIGAGNYSQSVLLPNFKGLADQGVEVVSICNRTPESTRKVAAAFGISHATTDYREVLARSDVDAVFIGTPPYAHRETVLAALDAGKHVLCQTRMAESAQQARDMHERAVRAGREQGLKTMLCRPDSFLKGDRFIRHLLATGYVGRIHQVLATRVLPNFAASTAPLQRRQNIKYFGAINPMHIGFYWDIMHPWVGDARRVLAQAHTFTTEREEVPGGPRVTVGLPDSVTAVAEMESGAIVNQTQLWAGHFGPSRIEIYGENGTLVYISRIYDPRGERMYDDRQQDEILGAQVGEGTLKTLPIPPEYDDEWRVEEDFVRYVRGEVPAMGPTFLDGVKNMEYLEAVYTSTVEGRWVDLPRH
ncbi:MAG: Gfo/Idh/MocA family oxidoreductase [Dehalococcoidia bacterium]|nr:Gfo/Idh/MocA family oxidoreductase [Dehalococcoidia bacterium]